MNNERVVRYRRLRDQICMCRLSIINWIYRTVTCSWDVTPPAPDCCASASITKAVKTTNRTTISIDKDNDLIAVASLGYPSVRLSALSLSQERLG